MGSAFETSAPWMSHRVKVRILAYPPFGENSTRLNQRWNIQKPKFLPFQVLYRQNSLYGLAGFPSRFVSISC